MSPEGYRATMSSGGRPRDEALDDAIVAAAARVLLSEGIDAVSFSRVAELAGTTRPALYRRFGSPAELVVAALHRIASESRPDPTGDPLTDLENELRHFRDGISRANSIALVGSMLTPGVDERVLADYRELLVRPRRARIAAILHGARRAGLLTASPADLDVATTMCTGSFYAAALAGTEPPKDWPRRVARLVWRAAGGEIA